MSKAFDISVGSLERTVHNHLKMSNVSDRWVPRMWTIDTKTDWFEKSHESLELIEGEMTSFQKRTVVGDEM